MWSIFRLNILKATASGSFSSDADAFAEFYVREYDACMKRGGDMIYGVPVMNGNTVAMEKVIKDALKKGRESTGENFNLLQEICPAAFDAYWLNAEMSPLPNPLFKPIGWQSCPPPPGTVLIIGPDVSALSTSTAKHKILVELYEQLVEELKKQTVNIEGIGEINVYETASALEDKKDKSLSKKVKSNPTIRLAKELLRKFKQAKNKKPSIGSNTKKAIKIPWPKLPSRKKLIEEAKNKLIEQALKKIEDELRKSIILQLTSPIQQQIKATVNAYKQQYNEYNVPNDDEIKKFVQDTIDGVTPTIALPNVNLPKIPTKEEFEKKVNDAIPTKEQLKTMAQDAILNLIPEIPYFQITPPTYKFSFSNTLINPFINQAKTHLMNVGGTMQVLVQYQPPATPGPYVLIWSGYRVLD